MKKKIRVGEGCALSRHKHKPKQLYRYISLLAVLTSMCLYAVKQVSAQVAEPAATAVADIKPLQIGDTIPQALWDLPLKVVNHPDGKDTITLNDYRDKKLIILDFWATWCKSCIEGFPKLEAYQRKYADDLGVLLVNAKQTGDSPQRIAQTFARYYNKFTYSPALPYMVADTVFQSFFPHRSLPHLIWIGSGRVYLAASYSEAVTSANIESAFNGDVSNIHLKRDGNGVENQMVEGVYRSALSHYSEGAGFQSGRLIEQEGNTLYRIVNYPLRHLYKTAYRQLLDKTPQNQWMFSNAIDTVFIRGIKDPKRYVDSYCYELYVPRKITSTQAADMLRADLERVFSIAVRKRTKDARVLVMQVTNKTKRLATEGKIQQIQLNPAEGPITFQNVYLPSVLDYISDLLDMPTEYMGDFDFNVDVSLPREIERFSEPEMVHLLESIGIIISDETRQVEFAQFVKID